MQSFIKACCSLFYKADIKIDQILWKHLGLQFYLSHPVLFFHRKPYNIRWEIRLKKINFCCCNNFKDVKSIYELSVESTIVIHWFRKYFPNWQKFSKHGTEVKKFFNKYPDSPLVKPKMLPWNRMFFLTSSWRFIH